MKEKTYVFVKLNIPYCLFTESSSEIQDILIIGAEFPMSWSRTAQLFITESIILLLLSSFAGKS